MLDWVRNMVQPTVVAGLIAGFISLIAIRLKQRPTLVKLEDDRHTHEITRLDGLIAGLAQELKTERAERTADRADFDRRLEQERRRHERVSALLRHRLRNEQQAMSTMLELLEMNPDRVPEIVTKVRALRAENERNIAAESGAMLSGDAAPIIKE